MFGYDLPRLHAAVNDLPAALLLAAVLFDLIGWAMKRESLVWAGIWTLWAGVIGGWAAVILGLMAEDKIDHGEAIHDLMEAHQTWGIVTMVVFTVVLAWKLWRRFQLRGGEDKLLKLVSLVALSVQVSWMALDDWAVAARFDGVAGGNVAAAWVMALAVSDQAELPAALMARTR